MPYPYPEPTNVGNLTSMFQYTNNVTNGLGVPMVVIGLYLVITLYMRGRDPSTPIMHCMAAAGFITIFPATFFYLSGVLPWMYFLYAAFGLVIPTVLIMLFK